MTTSAIGGFEDPALRRGNDRTFLATVLTNRASYHAAAGEWALARVSAIACLALVIAHDGDVTRAAQFAGYSDAAVLRHGTQNGEVEKTTRTRLDALLRASLSTSDHARLTTGGETFTTDTAVALTRI